MIRLLTFMVFLGSLSLAHAAVYTVGAGGTHGTIQGAIDAALVAPGSDEIRVAEGTFSEHLDFTPTGSGNFITMSGGWNAGFTAQGSQRSVIDGGSTGRVFNINMGAGDGFSLHHLKIQNGNASVAAGLLITQYDDSVMNIDGCEIVGNTAEDDRAESGGLRATVDGTSQFQLLNSTLSNNHAVCSGDVDCREGGMGLQASNSAQVNISGNVISNNTVTIGSGSVLASGASVSIVDTATLLMEDNQVLNNMVSGTGGGGTGVGLGLSGDGFLTVRRNLVMGNMASLPNPSVVPQVSFFQWGSQASVLSDSVIVQSNVKGLVVSTSGDGAPTVHVTNLTVADNGGTGVQASKNAVGGALNLSNTISVSNGTNVNLSVEVQSTANLVSGSAGFVDAPSGDYRLTMDSPARDAGSNSPPGGLGPTDIDGNGRINAGTVDQGAYEFQSDEVFADSFETF